MQSVLTQAYQTGTSLNVQADEYLNRALLSTASLFPEVCYTFIENHGTELKVMFLGLALVAGIRAIFGRHSSKPILQRSAGILAVAATGAPFLLNLWSITQQGHPYCAVSVATLMLGAAMPPPGVADFVSQQWDAFCSKAKQAAQQLSLGSNTDQINQQAEKEGDELIAKIGKVMYCIHQFDHFIQERPELLQLCQRYLQEDKQLIEIDLGAALHFTAKELDPLDPIDRKTKLLLKFNRIEFLWQTRMRFIQRHPFLEERMWEYMRMASRNKAIGRNLLEYR